MIRYRGFFTMLMPADRSMQPRNNSGHEKFVRIFGLLVMSAWLWSPIRPANAEIGFSCCLCTVGTVQNICAMTPSGVPCSSSATTLNAFFKKKATCEALTDDKCKSKNSVSSGLCVNEPAIAEKITSASIPGLSAANATGADLGIKKPELGINIPGVVFPDQVEITDGKIINPFLAIYIVGFQKYLMGLTLVAAAIMLVWGGFRYLTSSIAGDLQKAKDQIQNAVIGMVIALSAFVILSNINPQTTAFAPIKIDNVQKVGTPSDPKEALAMTQKAATLDKQYATVEGSGAANAAATKAATQTGGTGPVKSKRGGYVAQGNCPPDMVAIKQSPTYTYMGGKGPVIKIASFCIDRFEAPNQKGVKPYNGVQNIEADLYCDSIGKRLCDAQEWQRACSGPNGKNIHSYPGQYIVGRLKKSWDGTCDKGSAKNVVVSATNQPPAPCNYDSTGGASSANYLNDVLALDKYYPKFLAESILNPNNPALIDPDYKAAYDKVKTALNHLTASEPSGTRASCMSEEGVIDMVGNVAEIVVNDKGAAMAPEQRQSLGPAELNSKAYSWMSFYWSPVAHLDCRGVMAQASCFNTFGGSHALSWRGMENGFRCCMDLNDNPEAAPTEAAPPNATNE